MFWKSLILLNGGQLSSLVWVPPEYAAPNDCQIRISSGGETKKIKVLDSEPNQSLAKSPNAHWTALYAIFLNHFLIADLERHGAWSIGHRVRRQRTDDGDQRTAERHGEGETRRDGD